MSLNTVKTSSSYFPHLVTEGATEISLDLSYDNRTESIGTLVGSFCGMLDLLESCALSWVYSSLGPLTPRHNLSVLQFLVDHEFEVAYTVFESSKETPEDGIGFSEIAFTCPLPRLREFLEARVLTLGWNLLLAGWLVQNEHITEVLSERKFDGGGFHLSKPPQKLSFCSSDDWDCIQFFSPDRAELEKLFTFRSRRLDVAK
jgi:hypothetical protein